MTGGRGYLERRRTTLRRLELAHLRLEDAIRRMRAYPDSLVHRLAVIGRYEEVEAIRAVLPPRPLGDNGEERRG